MIDVVRRPAARVLCLDPDERVLLLCWRDPVDGRRVWEPPGGGIEAGESALEAARRELFEETGLPPEVVSARSVPVPRDTVWKGRRVVATETFFAGRVAGSSAPRLDNLEDYEAAEYGGHVWAAPEDLAGLDGVVEPPTLRAVLAELEPDGRWAASR